MGKNIKQLEILGTGNEIRDYSYVAYTVAAILLVGSHPEAKGEVYNIAGGAQYPYVTCLT